jgi:hypothetical protein
MTELDISKFQITPEYLESERLRRIKIREVELVASLPERYQKYLKQLVNLPLPPQNYENYKNSNRWWNLKDIESDRCGNRCENPERIRPNGSITRCWMTQNLEMHHIRYPWHELGEYVVILCKHCHDAVTNGEIEVNEKIYIEE